MENTAAASVEETIDPKSKPSSNGTANTRLANHPTVTAVTNTPRVDRLNPAQRIVRVLPQSVSNPPEKRINTSATTPMVWAK
jgi:hypothetical protein